MLGRFRSTLPAPAAHTPVAPATPPVVAPSRKAPGVAWLILGVVIGCLLTVVAELRPASGAVPVSTLVARAAAELRCECPVCPPPAGPASVPAPRVPKPKSTAVWTDPWWQDTAGKYGIVVVEPRLHPALIFIITDTLAKIPPTWNAIVFFSVKNEKFLRLALEPWIKSGRVTLKPFPSGNDGCGGRV